MGSTNRHARSAMFAAGLGATVMLAACETPVSQTLPDGVTPQDVAAFRSAVTTAGCDITRENSAQVGAETGFDRDRLQIITQYLTLAGESEPTASGFRLTSGSCANA